MNPLKFIWANTHQLFYMLGNIDSYRRYSDIPFNRAERALQVSHGNRMTCYLSERDFARYVDEGELFLDRAKAKRYIEAAKKQCADHQSFYARCIAADFTKARDTDLLEYWRELIDQYAHTVAYFRSTQDEPSRLIVETVVRETKEEDAQKLLISPELDVINEEEIAWEELMKSGFVREGALAHLKQFPWLFQNTLSYEETVLELAQRAHGHVSRDIKKEKAELKERQREVLTRYPHIHEHVATLQELALLRPLIKAAWSATGFYALPLLMEVARRTGVDLKTLVFKYRSEDVDALIERKKVLTDTELADIDRCTAYLFEEGAMHVAVGAEAETLEKELLHADATEPVTELTGTGARPGKVKGRVHILDINEPKVTKRFRDSFTGGILVTSMTQPNVVDIARRASAIVTDEGGMLCHAAIISREFGIPCVVGTHRATQVLKDGMEVEVDADKGVVTILK